jgi:hypothetical protein
MNRRRNRESGQQDSYPALNAETAVLKGIAPVTVSPVRHTAPHGRGHSRRRMHPCSAPAFLR